MISVFLFPVQVQDRHSRPGGRHGRHHGRGHRSFRSGPDEPGLERGPRNLHDGGDGHARGARQERGRDHQRSAALLEIDAHVEERLRW